MKDLSTQEKAAFRSWLNRKNYEWPDSPQEELTKISEFRCESNPGDYPDEIYDIDPIDRPICHS